jgi:hypothetical protein
MKILILFLSVLMSNNCSKPTEKDATDLYRERVILANLLKPTADPKGACVKTTSRIADCLPFTTDAKNPFGLTNEQYTTIALSSLTGKNFTNYSDYCDDAIKSPFYEKASEQFKECHFSCQKGFWDYQVDNNVCKNSTSASFNDGIRNYSIDCVIKCSKDKNQ